MTPRACGQSTLKPRGKLAADIERRNEIELGLGHGPLR
jgi:hypothetical protein